MTTLARISGSGEALIERQVASARGTARLLLARLHEESDRQVPFSQAKMLLREAASEIERLEAELTRVTAELERERAAPQGRETGRGQS